MHQGMEGGQLIRSGMGRGVMYDYVWEGKFPIYFEIQFLEIKGFIG